MSGCSAIAFFSLVAAIELAGNASAEERNLSSTVAAPSSKAIQ